MSRAKQIEKMAKIIQKNTFMNFEGQLCIKRGIDLEEILVDNGIGTKDRFEVWDSDGMKLGLGHVEPIDYKENDNDKSG